MQDLPESLPDLNHTFQVDLVGNVTKKRFLGDFVCKIPTIKDQAMIAKHEAFLNGEYPVYLNPGVLKIHKQIAYLKYTLIDVPKFWRESDGGYDLRDPNVVSYVYDQVLEFEKEWYQQIWGEDEDGQAQEG
jgi:hypothetical protein